MRAKDVLYFLLLNIIMIVVAVPVMAQSLSTDELLEYSLKSLRTTMDAAVEENQKLSAKNSSIRKRLLFLKKEFRELDDRLMTMKEGAVDIKNNIKLDAKELKVEEKRLNNFLERKRHLEFERDILKKQIETSALERNSYKGEHETFQFDLKELEGEMRGAASSHLVDYFSDEKLKLLDMIKENRTNVDKMKEKLERYELKVADKMRSQEVAVRQQESFKHELSKWNLRLKEEEARGKLLNKSMQEWKETTKEHNLLVSTHNQSRQEYIKELKNVIEEINFGCRKINDQFNYEEKEMNQYLSLLKDKNELLFRYQQSLEDEGRLTQNQQSEEHVSLLLKEQNRDIARQKGLVEGDLEQLQNKISQQQKTQGFLERDEQRWQKKLKDLTTRISKAKQSVEEVRKDAFGKKREELDKALKEQERRLGQVDAEKQKILVKSEDKKQQIQSYQDQKKMLEDEVERQKKTLQELDAQREDLEKQQQEITLSGKEKVESVKAEIRDDGMRRKVLQASVDVIHKKYNGEEVDPQGFESEQKELVRYLEVLKKENKGLQQKLNSLQRTDG